MAYVGVRPADVIDLSKSDALNVTTSATIGGELTVEGIIIPQKVGSLIQIPQPEGDIHARPKHGVSEVTKGTRYSLVFWNFI